VAPGKPRGRPEHVGWRPGAAHRCRDWRGRGFCFRLGHPLGCHLRLGRATAGM